MECNGAKLHCQALFHSDLCKKRKSAARAKTKKANKRIYNNKNNNKKSNEDEDYDKDYDEDEEKGQRGAALEIRGTTPVNPARDQKAFFPKVNVKNLPVEPAKQPQGQTQRRKFQAERSGKEKSGRRCGGNSGESEGNFLQVHNFWVELPYRSMSPAENSLFVGRSFAQEE